jgi:hypothetical protein
MAIDMSRSWEARSTYLQMCYQIDGKLTLDGKPVPGGQTSKLSTRCSPRSLPEANVVTSPRHHTLLIGSDAYDGGGSLQGCVNDIDAIQCLLTEHVGIAPESIARLTSPLSGDADPATLPTLANISKALDRLADAGPEDRVLVYYSGHGTQCNVVDATGRKFAHEALLPRRTSRMTVILDAAIDNTSWPASSGGSGAEGNSSPCLPRISCRPAPNVSSRRRSPRRSISP